MLTKARVFCWIGWFCLAWCLFPYYSYRSGPTGSEAKFTLGIPISPWLTASWLDKEERIDNGMSSSFSSHHSHSINAELISWSALFGIAGIVLLTGSRWLGKKQANSSRSGT